MDMNMNIIMNMDILVLVSITSFLLSPHTILATKQPPNPIISPDSRDSSPKSTKSATKQDTLYSAQTPSCITKKRRRLPQRRGSSRWRYSTRRSRPRLSTSRGPSWRPGVSETTRRLEQLSWRCAWRFMGMWWRWILGRRWMGFWRRTCSRFSRAFRKSASPPELARRRWKRRRLRRWRRWWGSLMRGSRRWVSFVWTSLICSTGPFMIDESRWRSWGGGDQIPLSYGVLIFVLLFWFLNIFACNARIFYFLFFILGWTIQMVHLLIYDIVRWNYN